MFKKIFYLILILKLIQARNGFVPKLYSQDRAAIVDAEISMTQSNNKMIKYPNRIRMPPPFPLWRHYPRYRVIPPPPPGQILAINTWAKTTNSKPVAVPSSTRTTSTTSTTTTTTTTTPKPTTTTSTTAIPKYITSPPFITDDEFPTELLDIAQNKLGLKSLDEIPSISELGQLLGTNNTEDTLSYIRQLTSNEQGVNLMKAYIESTDYTDNSGDFKNKIDDLADDDEEDDIGDIEEPIKVSDEGLIVINDDDYGDYELNTKEEEQDVTTAKPTLKPRKTPKATQKLKGLSTTHSSFMERVVNYMHLNNLFHKNKQESDTKLTENKEYHQLNRITENGKKVYNKQKTTTTDNQENQTDSEIINPNGNKSVNLKTPILVRDSIPFNYPVPIRVQSTTTTSLPPTTIAPTANTPTVVHLNTPKMLVPHVQHLARVTKIPSKKIEDFLTSKPKLLELATKISRFPIGYDRNSPMEAQVMAAVQRAIEKDEDLKKLLSSTATLK